ncbi:MAG: 1-(5-phosphoribosyl)-5-[(5-phosphoribosylamino)methylideneamino]imidazole-4-carboxamide isomerase [Flavobacteriales bacterium]|nr:1-(5-phosphoribosyl)-5-[(5-phosphoribosylamino)methylideneamino]imidazole-4-carboxamide isomerase [Flavobacteriales bacterium]
MTIIPAIDLINGQCVRLTQGDYSQQKTYSSSPVEMALEYQKAGFTRLHLVDLDGAKASHVVNIDTLKNICKTTKLKIDFGGGIKTDDDIRAVFDAGASFACIGSVAFTAPELTKSWIERYGADKIIIGADVKDEKICTHGWKNITDTTIFDMVEGYAGMISHLMCTDISKDGMLAGTSVSLYEKLMKRFPDVTLIASGGVSCVEDIEDLEKIGMSEVIVGKAIYEKRITLAQLRSFELKK